MDFTYLSYLLGPQLIGILFVILGLVQKYLPPKNVNRWYGYRTPLARSSQRYWDEGNRFSANYMIRAGFMVFGAGVVLKSIMILTNASMGEQKVVDYIILFGSAVGIGMFMVASTEKHLKQLPTNITPKGTKASKKQK